MTLTGLSFLFVFLPLALVGFYLFPKKWRGQYLLGITAVAYFLAEPAALLAVGLSVAMDYGAVRLMACNDHRPPLRRFCMWFSVIKNLCMLGYTGARLQIEDLAVPLGLAVYTLTAMGAVIDFYKKEIPYETHFWRFALHCTFFPKLYAGILMPYAEFAPQMKKLSPTWQQIATGAGKYIQGVGKSVIFAVPIGALYQTVRGFAPADTTPLSTWCTMLLLALALYFQLSGLSDMAVGLGRLFGLELPKNFYYPYQARSVEDFFQRFNITINRFIRKYVFINLDADKNGFVATSLNLLVVGMLMGLWFGLRINYMLWGAYLACYIIIEKYVLRRFLALLPTLVCRIYSFCVVLSSFTIFTGESVAQSFGFIRKMFGSAVLGEENNSRMLYLLSSNWLLLLLGCFLLSNAVDLLFSWLAKQSPRLFYAVTTCLNLFILLITTAFLVA